MQIKRTFFFTAEDYANFEDESTPRNCAGKPTTKLIEDVTDQWSVLVKNLGMKIPFLTL
jgi:hypothetical protein